ncbi:MAG: hypothetical protein GY869_20930 [Planctomycetes bacterium]|nr:hypothetical protein [Planctomycetota bacterium]
MRPIQMCGLLLWRGGLLLIGATVLFEVARLVLRFIDLPLQLEIGFGFVIAGLTIIILSLIIERIQDSRAEGDLKE